MRPPDRSFPLRAARPRIARPAFALRFLAVVLAAACASGIQAGEHTDPDLLTRAQIDATQTVNLFDAVALLRGNWFRFRGSEMSKEPMVPQVYFDNVRMGDTAALRNIPVSQVQYIRHYSGTVATTRWGLDHGAGVIMVSTRPLSDSTKGRPPAAREVPVALR